MLMEKKIFDIFSAEVSDSVRLKQLREMPSPEMKYIIAMTPRSGTSYLCDVLKSTGQFGKPDEYMNFDFIPDIIKHVPACNADEYLEHVFKHMRSKNNYSGLKVSWFQFLMFKQALSKPFVCNDFKYIYLTRRDLALQAVSLYKATESNVFHTNVSHSNEELKRLGFLQYDFEKIQYWYKHILAQELGWNSFFMEAGITPLSISYEEIERDIKLVIRRIAVYLGVNVSEIGLSEIKSIFRKIGDRKNLVWSRRFMIESYDRGFKYV